jgi:hypothetical protein
MEHVLARCSGTLEFITGADPAPDLTQRTNG